MLTSDILWVIWYG